MDKIAPMGATPRSLTRAILKATMDMVGQDMAFNENSNDLEKEIGGGNQLWSLNPATRQAVGQRISG